MICLKCGADPGEGNYHTTLGDCVRALSARVDGVARHRESTATDDDRERLRYYKSGTNYRCDPDFKWLVDRLEKELNRD